MRLIPVTLAIALIAAPGSLARDADPGLFGNFRSICAADPDPVRGVARALEQGFLPAKKPTRAPGLDEAKGFEKTVGDRAFFVIVGRGKGKPRDGMPASATIACDVGVKGKDEAAMAAGRKWVGAPVSRSVLGVAFHAFRQTGDARTALSFDDKAATRAAVAAGDLNVLTVSPLGGVTFLMLSRTRVAT
jgi:hypothetical protein